MPNSSSPISSDQEDLRKRFFENLSDIYFVEDLFDQDKDIVFSIKDREGRYISMSKTCVERCGLKTRLEALGKTAFDLFPEPMAKRYSKQDEKIFKTGKAMRNTLDITSYQNGKSGWCIKNKIPLYDHQKEIIGIACISRDLNLASESGWIGQSLAKVLDTIQENYRDPLPIPKLAAMANLSVQQFERRIRKIFQITAGQLITKTRLDAATEMLADPKKSISNIAYDCGFSDHSSFSRQFKLHTGMSPKEYRENMIFHKPSKSNQ